MERDRKIESYESPSIEQFQLGCSESILAVSGEDVQWGSPEMLPEL